MKRAFAILIATIVFALAGTSDAETNTFYGNTYRLDVRKETYEALGKDLFAGIDEWYGGTKQMNSFQLFPQSMLKMIDEINSNSARLIKDEYEIDWYSEAIKIAYDERMIGARVWVEFENEEEKMNIDEKDIFWKDGVARFNLPEGRSYNAISALCISYETSSWLDTYFSFANYSLLCEILDGKVVSERLNLTTEDGAYVYDWHLSRNQENGRLILGGSLEDLSRDIYCSVQFDVLTGEYIE